MALQKIQPCRALLQPQFIIHLVPVPGKNRTVKSILLEDTSIITDLGLLTALLEMASIEQGFHQAMAEFKIHLKPEEESMFSFTTLHDLEAAAIKIQDSQRKRKTAQNLKRIRPFLQAMEQYKDIIEVFLNTSSVLCFVWGPMKFMLMVNLLVISYSQRL